jgi:hypothetical protein
MGNIEGAELMRRQALQTLAATLILAAAGRALAQEGDLSGVTMRVVDELSAIDAVIIELDPSAVGDPQSGEVDAAPDGERRRDATERDDAAKDEAREPAGDPP